MGKLITKDEGERLQTSSLSSFSYCTLRDGVGNTSDIGFPPVILGSSFSQLDHVLIVVAWDQVPHWSCSYLLIFISKSAHLHLCADLVGTKIHDFTLFSTVLVIGMAHVPRHRFHTFEKSHFQFHQNLPLSPPPSSHCRYARLPEVWLNLHK